MPPRATQFKLDCHSLGVDADQPNARADDLLGSMAQIGDPKPPSPLVAGCCLERQLAGGSQLLQRCPCVVPPGVGAEGELPGTLHREDLGVLAGVLAGAGRRGELWSTAGGHVAWLGILGTARARVHAPVAPIRVMQMEVHARRSVPVGVNCAADSQQADANDALAQGLRESRWRAM